jgi:DNA topoisomerase-2
MEIVIVSGITSDLSIYRKLTETEHVLLRPGRYIGSVITTESKQWVPTQDAFGNVLGIHEETILFNYGLLKLFDEIVSNSIDESKRNKNLRSIDINIDNDVISVWDNGGIPVKKHPEHDQWIPEMIFGELRSGSNFNDDMEETRTGTHGEGSSLVNIFSSEFTVETCDGSKRYVQKWSDNMSIKSEPTITDVTRSGYTKITFKPDLARLGMETISRGMWVKLLKRTLDIVACSPHIKVRFCGSLIKIDSFKDYIELFDYPNKDDGELLYHEDGDWKVGIANSVDGFRQVSFVNSTETYTGGTHVEYVMNQIVSHVREFILKKHKVDIKPSDVRNHMFVFIDASVVNPKYNSQTKDNLITESKTFKSAWTPSPKFIKAICESEIVESILNWMAAKDEVARKAELAKFTKEIKKFDPRTIEKFVDATTRNREDAILFVVEGDSAAGGLKNNRNTENMGVFPLRGKPLNISEFDITTAMKNKEFKQLMAIIGLLPGEETPLRFGKVVISTDQDLDGFHIRGLLINMFDAYFPELLRDNRIYILNTPLAKITYRKEVLKFYSLSSLNAWVDSHRDSKYKMKYYKGLGTSNDDEWAEYLTPESLAESMVLVTKDHAASENLKVVFGKHQGASDERKLWLDIEEK